MSADAKFSLDHGNRYPFDAPDAWWRGDVKNLPQVDWAHRAARGVLADLTDRRSIKQALSGLDQEVRIELVESLAAIIRTAKEEA